MNPTLQNSHPDISRRGVTKQEERQILMWEVRHVKDCNAATISDG